MSYFLNLGFFVSIQFLSFSAFGADTSTSAVSVSEDWQKCEASFPLAKSACTDPNSSAGMSSANSSNLTSQLLIASQLATTAGAASGSAEMCKIAAGLSSAMQIVTLLKGDACSSTRNKCENSCGEFSQNAQNRIALLSTSPELQTANGAEIRDLTKKIATAQKSAKTCDAYQTQSKNAALQYLLLANSLATAYKCATDLSSTTPTATPLDLTTTSYDCSNASFAATSMVCICQSTPSDPMCGTSYSSGTSTSGAIGAGSVATPTLSTEATDGVEVDTTPIGAKSQAGSSTASGGGSGGLGSSGSGSQLGAGVGSDGTASGFDKNVITGTGGSSGGVAALAAGSPGGDVNKGGSTGGSGSASGGNGLDLKKYLPKSLFKNRGLAGMSVPSSDGVTGPMGPSLWEKVSNRYQAVKTTLIRD